MLSQNQVVVARKAIESTYTDKCNITEYVNTKINNVVSTSKELITSDEPCRLSFSKLSSTTESDEASSVAQIIKLFISPDIEIKPGSIIEVSRNSKTTRYKASGKPAVYLTHQEIILELEQRWA